MISDRGRLADRIPFFGAAAWAGIRAHDIWHGQKFGNLVDPNIGSALWTIVAAASLIAGLAIRNSTSRVISGIVVGAICLYWGLRAIQVSNVASGSTFIFIAFSVAWSWGRQPNVRI